MGDSPADPGDDTSSGRYELVTRLAMGGMAEIHLARTRGISGFERYVVIKQLLAHLSCDDELVRLFLDECRLAAMLDHQNIGQVYEMGRLDGRYFFAMEYLHGKDARDLLEHVSKRGERIPLGHALTIVTQVAAALRYAHQKRDASGQPMCIVHRDVSPANILITYDGAVKLVDFGIARATTRTLKTRTGAVRGKVFYMSPEQCLGRPVDARSDLFALGIVLYELATTSRLFVPRGPGGEYLVMDRIAHGDVPPPSTVVDGFPAALESIIMRALALDPDDRYPDADDLLVALEGMAAASGTRLSTVALAEYLVSLFGRPPEPWRAAGSDDRDAGPAAASAVPEAVPEAIDDDEITGALPGEALPGAAVAAERPDAPEGRNAGASRRKDAPEGRNAGASRRKDAREGRNAGASRRPDAPEGRNAGASRRKDAAAPHAVPQVSSGANRVEPSGRRLALPLPASRPSSDDGDDEEADDAVPSRISVEQTLPTPPPPLDDDDEVSIEVVLPARTNRRLWPIALLVLAAAAMVVIAVVLVR